MSETREPKRATATVLVADDEPSMRELLSLLLEAEGYEVVLAADGTEAAEIFARERDRLDVVIQDLKMPGLEGIELLRRIKAEAPELPVIVITAFSSWDSAVEAMRLGAFDYIRKPFDTDTIRSVVARAAEKGVQARSGSDGDEAARRGPALIGNDRLVQEIFRMVNLIAPTDSTVLLQGESGTGKEIVARSIHDRSHRRDRPFVAVNCSAFPESLLESELFGHVRGAFTGAIENKQGLFRAANGGTVFLDEVADMSLTTQVKILRVLEERKINPVGTSDLHPIDVRIIAATNKNVEEEVRRRSFREDLFYRLNVIPLTLPPLRDRKDDIPLLAGHFLAKYSRHMNKKVTRISDRAQQTLHDYDWPGNVRELENIIQRHVALCEGDTIESLTLRGNAARDPPPAATSDCPSGSTPQGAGADPAPRGLIPEDGLDLEGELARFEREYLRQAIARTGGNLTGAAKLLNMSYRSIRYRVKKLRIRDHERGPTPE